MNLPSSQITSHLNNVPIKIQLLSLLIGFGSDRQPEPQCRFWFQNDRSRQLEDQGGQGCGLVDCADDPTFMPREAGRNNKGTRQTAKPRVSV